jgi:Fe-S-cluster containining protein
MRYTIPEIQKIVAKKGGSEDGSFILKNWKRISKREAFRLNSYLKDYEKDGQKINRSPSCHFFKCTKLRNNKCSSYDSRPKICQNYPFYGKLENPHIPVTGGCGFIKCEKNP